MRSANIRGWSTLRDGYSRHMAKHPPQKRLENTVLGAGVAAVGLDWFDADKVKVEPWMVGELRAAEASIRRLRREIEARLASAASRPSAGCGQPVTATRSDARYCSGRCRQAALRSRRGDG